MDAKQWEARRALRYGSEHVGFFAKRSAAVACATRDIERNGNVGRITSIIDRVVYYDIHEDDV